MQLFFQDFQIPTCVLLIHQRYRRAVNRSIKIASTGFAFHSVSSSSCVTHCLLTFKAFRGLAQPYIADLCRPVSGSHISRQQTETAIRHSWWPRGLLLRHALRHPCIHCDGSKGMEPAAGAFTGTIETVGPFKTWSKDLSLLYPVIVANCLDTPRPCNDFFSCYGARNRRRDY